MQRFKKHMLSAKSKPGSGPWPGYVSEHGRFLSDLHRLKSEFGAWRRKAIRLQIACEYARIYNDADALMWARIDLNRAKAYHRRAFTFRRLP